jgi:hypothetical protein
MGSPLQVQVPETGDIVNSVLPQPENRIAKQKHADLIRSGILDKDLREERSGEHIVRVIGRALMNRKGIRVRNSHRSSKKPMAADS